MTRWIRRIVVVFPVILVATVATASEPLAERISLDLEQAAAEEVFGSLEKMLGLAVDSTCPGSVTIRVQNVSVRTALEALTESLGCTWKLEPTRLVVRALQVPSAPSTSAPPGGPGLEEPISLQLRDADAREVLSALASFLGAELVAEAAVLEGKVSIELRALPVREALDHLCHLRGCSWAYAPEVRRLVVSRR